MEIYEKMGHPVTTDRCDFKLIYTGKIILH